MNRIVDLNTTRRGLLRIIGVVGGGLLASGGCRETEERSLGNVAPAANPGRLLRDAIREHFAYLSIGEEVVEAFARDLTEHQGPWSPGTSPRPFTRFLASTDFFQQGADENRPLRYVAYYDPYVSTCYNPFAG